MGVGLFLFGSCAAAFVASFLAHGFLTSTRWKLVAAVAFSVLSLTRSRFRISSLY